MSPCTRIALSAGLLCSAFSASAQVIQWNGAVSGNWNDPTRWLPQTVPNSATHTAIFNPGMYNPRLNISVAIDSVSVGNGVQLDIQAGQSLGIAGATFSNNGHMYINPTSATAGTSILVSGVPTTTVSGTGRISLNASPNLATATLNSGAGTTLVNTAGHTIEGSGRILATTHNDGVIRANLFEKYLQISAPVTQSATGTFLASGGFAGISDGSLTGGIFTCSDGGKGRIDGNGTINNVTTTPQCTIEINPGAVLHLAGGGVTNNGFVVVNTTAANAGTFFRFDETATMNGTGRVVLNANTNLATAVIDSLNAAVGVNGPSHTISGTGRINSPLTNHGTIQADALAKTLEIRSVVNQSETGSIIGTSGGFASLGNGSLISGGTFASSNNGVVKTSPSETGTVNGVTSTATMHVDAGGVLALQSGGLVNNGSITVNPNSVNAITTLRFAQDATLSGSGILTLSASSNLITASIDAVAPAVGTNAFPHTITGSGRISAPMINSGFIRGGSPNHYLEIRNTMSQSGGGRMIAEDTGSVVLANGSLITGGTFETIGDGRVRVGASEIGTVDNVTNLGTLHVDGGGRLTVLSGGLVNNGLITINPNTVNAITSLFAAANTTLSGTGTLVLNANSNLNTAVITTADNAQMRLTNAVTHTITGHGNVDAPIDNDGTIAGSSTSPTAIVALRATVNQSATGRLVGNVGSPALAGATVNGGRFQGVGRVRALAASSAINNVVNETTFALDGGAVVAVNNLTNNGTILVNSDSLNAITNLSFSSPQTILGSGTIRLSANSNLVTASLNTSAANLVTLSSQQTLRGTGRLSGAFSLQGTTAPGFNDTAGQIDFNTATTFGANHILLSKASGTTIGLFDRITSSSTIALNGTLNASFVSGYNPTTPCTEFELIRANGGISGEFTSVLLPSAPSGYKWRIAYSDNAVTLRLSCRPDVNVDCIIDFFDYLDFVADFSAGDRSADYNEDDVIDFFDYLDFVADFAAGC